MSLQISRWNPFRFKRQAHGTPQSSGTAAGASPPAIVDSAAAPGQARSQSAMGWPQAMAMPGLLNPFNLVPGMLFNPFSGFGSLDRWFGDFSPGVVNPQLDVVDDGDALRITAELAGMDRDNIEVLLQDDILVIRGEKKQERGRRERLLPARARVRQFPADNPVAGRPRHRPCRGDVRQVGALDSHPQGPRDGGRQRQRKEDPDQVGAARRFRRKRNGPMRLRWTTGRCTGDGVRKRRTPRHQPVR